MGKTEKYYYKNIRINTSIRGRRLINLCINLLKNISEFLFLKNDPFIFMSLGRQNCVLNYFASHIQQKIIVWSGLQNSN